ncbi:8-amino-7-oxononanoate synthase family protein [Couchioplanes caeruleus]|uniref:8-amino-7-oxononanoate synthase n=2 Tax=Couchioplanes caeruleus TaxID=56438 RepID=A0A1K0GRC8_9ACTN|nr:aminotransferase class I/II-fold pyridoxal phosphate-dependent enzyme [Couchioplanes caeruleus]OJF14958.1 aminotransferase class I and II [Couchioplanes caeruleus subsp. caeruleus]ROP30433.1 7-keto-8-aminopelargonate synthetase-like enzyme [Couchioplanes caeruleus]
MSERKTITPTHRYRNNDKLIGVGNTFWNMSEEHGVAGIVGDLTDGVFRMADGHEFVNFTVCSYLDLDTHPKVIDGAVDALRRFGVLDHCIPRTRVQTSVLLELEESLGELFGAMVISAISTAAASTGLLPLISSGHLGNGTRPLMVFDKNAHVSLANAKPSCADETEVVTCRHHDLDYLEDMCRTYERVCYVVDGSDSLGGYAPVDELAVLQDKYNLMVFYDDSHSLSAYGERGIGYVRSHSPVLDERTITVATLSKGFGAGGTAILLDGYPRETRRIIERFAGPLGYSQKMNAAAVGAALASADIHRTDELTRLQGRLRSNIALFDSLIATEQSGSTYPIRLVPMSDETVISAGQQVFEAGFYVSPVFFPIVARGTAGLRVMLRAGQTEDQIRTLCSALRAAGAREAAASSEPVLR